jgi:hypothetical protein
MWRLSVPLRMWRYRRWLLVGPIRWEASGSSDGHAVRIVLADDTGQLIEARRGEAGVLVPKPLSEMIEQGLGLLVLFALIGIVVTVRALLAPWLFRTLVVALVVTLGLGSVVWLRILLMRRKP